MIGNDNVEVNVDTSITGNTGPAQPHNTATHDGGGQLDGRLDDDGGSG